MQPFGYTGYQMEAAGGLYFAQARRYDASVGRFISEDKISGFSSAPFTLNRYNYCWNQPIDYIDLNGLSREDVRDYMEKYADEDEEKRNPNYPSYGNNCANFVSQCLVAGGVNTVDFEWFCAGPVNFNEFVPDWEILNWACGKLLKISCFENRVIDRNVYYNDMDPNYPVLLSNTWNSAPAQFEYFRYINGDVIQVTTVEELEQVSGVQVGDLIYWDWYSDSDGIVNHATIVSRVDADGTIYYAGNTSDHLEQKASDVLSLGEMYIVRLNDCIFD